MFTRTQIARWSLADAKPGSNLSYTRPILSLNDDLYLVFPVGFCTVHNQLDSEHGVQRCRKLRTIEARDATAKNVKQSLANRRRVAQEGAGDVHP